jgi:uncharacterized protein (DUF58 family)
MTSALQHEADILAEGMPPLLVAAERLAAAASLGVHGRRKAGIGEDFWQFRRYRSEDSTTAIDWRQSAKSQHLFVREREWDAAQSIWFWRDGSQGMRFASGDVTKMERASLIALALAALLVKGGERVALFGEPEPPSSSRLALKRMAHRLEVKPRDMDLPPEGAVTRNGHFVWLSDFLSPLNDIDATMRRLSLNGVGGSLVQIIDPAEEDFPYSGRTRFEDARGGESEILGRAESVAAAYRARFKAHGEALADMASRFGWNRIAHRTDRPAQTALIALYAQLGGGRNF